MLQIFNNGVNVFQKKISKQRNQFYQTKAAPDTTTTTNNNNNKTNFYSAVVS